jgi:uncharacterized protein DUF5335
MPTIAIPQNEWRKFLEEFSRRHHGWLVTLETHDLKTEENVASRFMPLEGMALDLEDEKNPRINVTVRSDEKQIKHILFRPSQLVVYRSERGEAQAVRIVSINTSTTVRFRVAMSPELVDGAA